MNYREHLFRPLSKRFVDHLVLEIFNNPSDFGIIYQLIFEEEEKVAWRAAWACQKISEKHPEWFSNDQIIELISLALSTTHGGLQRGCLAVLNNIALPDPIQVEFINACYNWMLSSKSPIAVQALSMKYLARICIVEPDFKPEFIAYLENIDFENYSQGFKTTRKNILRKLNVS